MRRHNLCSKAFDGVSWCLAVVEGQHPTLAFGIAARGLLAVLHPTRTIRAAPPGRVDGQIRLSGTGAARLGLMLRRIVGALLRSPVTLLFATFCLGLSAIGFGGAYLLLTLGLQTLSDPAMAWLLAGFGLLWAAFWLYMLGVVVRGALPDD
jgi:hypothetical protein